MYRDYTQDDPVRDAEIAQIDTRPRRFTCDQCGEPIRGADSGHYGDDFFEFKDVCVHLDCLSEWTRQFIKEAE